MVICKHRLETKPSASVAPHRELPEFHLDEPHTYKSSAQGLVTVASIRTPRNVSNARKARRHVIQSSWALGRKECIIFKLHSAFRKFVSYPPMAPPHSTIGSLHADLKCVEGILEALPRKSLKPQAKVAIVYSNQQKGTGNTGLESKNPLLLTTMKKVSTFILSAVGDLLCSIICTIQNKL